MTTSHKNCILDQVEDSKVKPDTAGGSVLGECFSSFCTSGIPCTFAL